MALDGNAMMRNRAMKTGINNKKNNLLINGLAMTARRLWQAIARAKRVAVPVTLALVLIVGVIVGVSRSSSPSYALTSKCTLSILSGSVDIGVPGISGTEPGTDGMTLIAGSRVKTSPDSSALLTFFDGSTLKLEPGTEIEIEQLGLGDRQTITIVLKQCIGKTWSNVVKMAVPHYEIQTPSAVALVRGTQFVTEVDEMGVTKVTTAEGLVSVSAQGGEVYLPVGQQTVVEPGTPPTEPTTVDISEYVNSQEKVQNGRTENRLSQPALPTSYQSNVPDRGNNQDQNNGNGQGNGKASSQAVAQQPE